MIKIATFNLENLFNRPAAMKMDDKTGKSAIEDHAAGNSIISKAIYSEEDKAKLLELCRKYKWHYLDPPKTALVQFKKIRGQLFRKTKTGDLSISADGRADWVGWLGLDALKRSRYVLIGGDLNDTPESESIQELLKEGFVDVIDHPGYPKDRSGTFATGLAYHKIDYLIMSPKLRKKLINTGIERKGTYHPNLWESFDTVTKSSEEASDHHLVWAIFNL